MNSVPRLRSSRLLGLTAILLVQSFSSSLEAADKVDNEKIEPGKRGVIRFSESPVQSSDKEQIALRLSASETPPDFDITQEEFEILVPEDYDASQPHGLFIWISAGKKPTIPAEWEPVLAEKNIIFNSMYTFSISIYNDRL